MTLPTNQTYNRLIEMIKSMGDAAHTRASDSDTYKAFITAFPLGRLPTLGADDYCVGKGDNHSFSW
jgi:5-methylcytosine-specific restriction protein B